jgi:hypothetical protein
MKNVPLFLFFILINYNAGAQFTQVEHGLVLTGMPVGHSSGVSWYDFDRDGWDDLTVAQGNDAILVLRNVNGTLNLFHVFPNTTQVKSFLWVDFDNDGDSDFFICAVNASCKLLRNDGNMVFTPHNVISFIKAPFKHSYFWTPSFFTNNWILMTSAGITAGYILSCIL